MCANEKEESVNKKGKYSVRVNVKVERVYKRVYMRVGREGEREGEKEGGSIFLNDLKSILSSVSDENERLNVRPRRLCCFKNDFGAGGRKRSGPTDS
jgi:hypothetical protein